VKRFRGRIIPENYIELCEMWEKYFIENGNYPTSLVCQINKELPAWSRVKEICDDKYDSFCEKHSINKRNIKKDFSYYCEQIKQLACKLERTPTARDLRKYTAEIPDYRWLVNNCPDEKVKGYNDLLNYIGLKPYYEVSKEMATNMILKKAKELNYKLKIEDFKYNNQDEIGIGTIKRIWGSFNNMLLELNLQINQVGRSTLEKSIEELENDIKQLCDHLYKINGHKIVSIDDVRNCEWCQSEGTYNRRFKMEFNMTLGEYISSIGFTPNKIGMGMVYEFEDGEMTKSKYEYEVSNYLREQNISYVRNVHYSTFTEYKGNKDCDYVININGELWYLEVAGMLTHDEINEDDYIKKKYKKDIEYKEKLLKESKVNYKIIYPNNFKEKQIHNIFSFLYKELV
jgi:hypothetical protein